MAYEDRVEVAPGVHVRFSDAGHILGSGIVELWSEEDRGRKKLVFCGDLGHNGNPNLPDPTPIAQADLIVIESTYGDRNHRPWADTGAQMAEFFAKASHEKGNILIPAFAVGPSQGLLAALQCHFDAWGLADWRIYLDSPMAIRATGVYCGHLNLVTDKRSKPAASRQAL